jgi:hypothetical protein
MVQTEFERYVVDRLDVLTSNQSQTCQDLREIKTTLRLHLEQKDKEEVKKYTRIKVLVGAISSAIGLLSVYNFITQFFSH